MSKKVQVKPKDLKWKSVQVSDTLDDFGGFYGLEEIDGVDVKIIDGKATFFATESKNNDVEQEQRESEDQELIEFKNLDDIEEGELSALSESDSDDEDDEIEDEDNLNDDDDELTENVFSADLDLQDVVSLVELPEWTKLAKFSMTTLQGLAKLGFTKPTEIQAKTIPLGLGNHDIMGKASTGSGKTLAYGIPMLENFVKSFKSKDNNRAIGLIFTPTRELAQQVTQHLTKVSELILKEKNKYAILSLTGGLSIQKQERLLKYQGSGKIVIATPGRFLELLEKNNELIERFGKIDTLVLDEADRLLQDGHFDEFEKILKLLGNYRKKSSKSHWQTMIFSATFSTDLFNKLASNHNHNKNKNDGENEMETVLKHLMTKIHFKSKPVIVDTNPDEKVSSQIKESLIECAPMERDLYVYYFLAMYPGTTLVFCNAIESVKRLNAYLNLLNISSFQIHSSMTQKNRLKNLEKFKQQAQHNSVLNKATVLIASDVAARGLDIPGIQHVIHYHLPRTADVYIHRSGRTARHKNEGVSVMICSPQESMSSLRKLRKVLSSNEAHLKKGKFRSKQKWQKTVPLLPIEIDIVSQLRERSKIASELADHDIASKSLSKDDNWLKKAAEDLGIDADSDDENKDTYLAKNKTKKINKTMAKDQARYSKAHLNELLSIPLRKDMRKKYLTGGLVNLADNLVKKRGHNSIIGQEEIGALALLKNKKNANKRTKK
ncbi:hypothetical protein KAFR_0G01440 [Kazachstania africana CBS 2517]|uniref:RNA helicase n=1 Tax=Kazachstania africana (strain ATCC 22294 / BCRC 22015 / CBS 2517 / CECT 1963 / NBRC 1671 / NRRL Y-8276) TaxID=1071382 RepID=H2AXS8_KAZAF|nr:hypothetical protein KAFR_0G01440 [Kazachstania africana CBS 2517]CCF59178.1 hypothetical protein KAFR_0G01440 [Kazachstania africana CBS 2517]